MELPIENQRVKYLIDYFCNGNELAFSNEIGVSQPRINRLFTIDKRNDKYPVVSFDIVQAIINKFINVSGDWLLTGRGEPIRKDNNEGCYKENDKVNLLKQSFENYDESDPVRNMFLKYLGDPQVQKMIREIVK